MQARQAAPALPEGTLNLAEAEKILVRRALEVSSGNKSRAAELLASRAKDCARNCKNSTVKPRPSRGNPHDPDAANATGAAGRCSVALSVGLALYLTWQKVGETIIDMEERNFATLLLVEEERLNTASMNHLASKVRGGHGAQGRSCATPPPASQPSCASCRATAKTPGKARRRCLRPSMPPPSPRPTNGLSTPSAWTSSPPGACLKAG